MIRAVIKAIEYYLPEIKLTNVDLSAEFPEWSVEKIEAKTGIAERHIARPDECASDLGVAAANQLFAKGICKPTDVDYLLFCTQSPDYFLPTTACIVQGRLGIPTTSGAVDFNLGCSGYVYGLGLAKGLIETGQAGNVLLITAETYTKFVHPRDRSVRTIFGDGAAATLIGGLPNKEGDEGEWIGPLVFGTDGGGAENLIVRAGGMRNRRFGDSGEVQMDAEGNIRAPENLYMNGSEIFAFTIRVVPHCVGVLLQRAKKTLDDIDLFVFHQANQYMLEHLRRKIRIPSEKFFLALRDCGNTVSSTIPIALKRASLEGRLRFGDRAMLVGFGVGYSWGAALVRWGAS